MGDLDLFYLVGQQRGQKVCLAAVQLQGFYGTKEHNRE